MKMISKSKLLEIRRSLYDDNGYTRINNPHFDLIFEEAFKAGIKQVNNVVLDDVSNRRELLIDFIEWYAENSTADFGSDEDLADWFLKVKDN